MSIAVNATMRDFAVKSGCRGTGARDGNAKSPIITFRPAIVSYEETKKSDAWSREDSPHTPDV